MTIRKLLFLAVAVLMIAASPVSAQKILAGDDGLTTPGGGTTTLNLGNFPVGELFGAALKSVKIVSLRGESLGEGDLDGIDTIVRRPKDIDVSSGSGSGPLEIVALRLVSERPVVIGNGEYTLRVFLSEFREGITPGSVTFTMANQDGGKFNSSFPVRTKLVFTDRDGKDTVIDCGTGVCGNAGELKVTAKSANFTISGVSGGFDPAASGVKRLPAGLEVDGDGDGRAELTTRASSNLFIGVIPARPTFPIGPVDKNEQNSGNHGVAVPVPAASSTKVLGTFTPNHDGN